MKREARYELSPELLPGLAAALAGAASAGLLEALLAGEGSAEELGARCGADPDAAARVLSVLEALGLARRAGPAFGPGPLLCAEADVLSEEIALWRGILTYLRTGRHDTWTSGAPAEKGPRYRNVAGFLARQFEPASVELADALGCADRMLDVGAGSGVWSLEMARRSPNARVVGLDLPDVCAAFRDRARRLGLEGRVETVTGDYHQVPLEEAAFDRILVANVLRIEPPERAEALLCRLAGALAPDGELVIVDVPDADPPERALARSIYRLHLALRSDAGGPHPEAWIRAWLARAGLERVFRINLEHGPVGEAAWIARRSAPEPGGSDAGVTAGGSETAG